LVCRRYKFCNWSPISNLQVNPGTPFAEPDIPRKIAESTGRLPPTPMLHAAAREHNAIEFGEAPPDRAKTPVMKSVRLKDSLTAIWLHDVIF
jgi:hypothetical protein